MASDFFSVASYLVASNDFSIFASLFFVSQVLSGSHGLRKWWDLFVVAFICVGIYFVSNILFLRHGKKFRNASQLASQPATVYE
jgi:hypothetical protein